MISLLLFTLYCILVSAGEKETIYRAYLTNDMAVWKGTIEAMHV